VNVELWIHTSIIGVLRHLEMLGLFLVSSYIPVDAPTFIERRPAWACDVICRSQWWKL